MKHGSLFSGMGGFDLASEWMGWENVFHCENNRFCQRILKYYWPVAASHGDIRKTDFTIYRGRIDILTGGFPCQPYSLAGKRKGKSDDRHLWPEMLRAIREIRPRWVVGENVPGIVSWGKGVVFEQIYTDLETEGYEIQSVNLPAGGKDAPHKRQRIWVIATNSNLNGSSKRCCGDPCGSESGDEQLAGCDCGAGITDPDISIGREGGMFEKGPETTEGHVGSCDSGNDTINADSEGFQVIIQRRFGGVQKENGTFEGSEFSGANAKNFWENFPTQSPVRDRNDGLSSRLDGITFPKWCEESIKAAGNAVVPQVVFEIFKAIDTLNKNEFTRLEIK